METRRIQVDDKFLRIIFNKDGYTIEEHDVGNYIPKTVIHELMPA